MDNPVVINAPFDAEPCQCVRNHVPRPTSVEFHHPFPQYAQRERYGRVVDDRTVALCGVAHNNVHEAIRRRLRGEDFRLGNRYQQALAEEGERRIREGWAPT